MNILFVKPSSSSLEKILDTVISKQIKELVIYTDSNNRKDYEVEEGDFAFSSDLCGKKVISLMHSDTHECDYILCADEDGKYPIMCKVYDEVHELMVDQIKNRHSTIFIPVNLYENGL